MPRLSPHNAHKRARLVRPLSDFTPEQRRLLLALIEAGATAGCPGRAARSPRRTNGGGRP